VVGCERDVRWRARIEDEQANTPNVVIDVNLAFRSCRIVDNPTVCREWWRRYEISKGVQYAIGRYINKRYEVLPRLELIYYCIIRPAVRIGRKARCNVEYEQILCARGSKKNVSGEWVVPNDVAIKFWCELRMFFEDFVWDSI